MLSTVSNMQKVGVLTEALPYLQKFFGKIVVIKYGGNAMINAELKQKVVQDIIFMKCTGMKPVVVHGGGPEITSALNQMGKTSSFVSGLRVTDDATMEVAEMVLVGKINTEIVNLLNRSGVKAVGLNGKDANLTLAKKHLAQVVENNQLKEVDIGFVGDVEKINPEIIHTLLDNDYIPVIAPTGVDAAGNSYNINADYVAGEIAAVLGAEKLLLLTDVEGLYRDFKNRAGFVSTLTFAEATAMIAKGLLDGGMIPKIEACVRALAGGAVKAHIIDGRLPHSLLLEVFTAEGIGTEVVKTKGGDIL